MDLAGCCPVLDDGLSAGNGAALLPNGSLLVSPSGRVPGTLEAGQLVEVQRFEVAPWRAEYRSSMPSLRPTSDTPLYWAALCDAVDRFSWLSRPIAALHGHVLDTEQAAALLDLPISAVETEFSTPDDRSALLDLLGRYPYPHHNTYIRRGHGFFCLGSTVDEALRTVLDLAAKARREGLLV